MTITVTLSTPMGKRLQTQADRVDLPLDDLVERMLATSLPATMCQPLMIFLP